MMNRDFDEIVYGEEYAYPPVPASSVEYATAHLRRSKLDDPGLAIVGIVAAVVVTSLSVVAFIVELTN